MSADFSQACMSFRLPGSPPRKSILRCNSRGPLPIGTNSQLQPGITGDMPTRYLAEVFRSPHFLTPDGLRANSQQNSSDTSSGDTVEGTVASVSRETLVVRRRGSVSTIHVCSGASIAKRLTRGARVRVTAGAADKNGTRTANDVTVLSALRAQGRRTKARRRLQCRRRCGVSRMKSSGKAGAGAGSGSGRCDSIRSYFFSVCNRRWDRSSIRG